jgi:hypothetical protein
MAVQEGNRRRSWGWGGIKQVLLPPGHLGLISLDGTVRPPRPFRDWRGITERLRCRTSVSRVQENRMHGLTGGDWKRAVICGDSAPVPDPPTLRCCSLVAGSGSAGRGLGVVVAISTSASDRGRNWLDAQSALYRLHP